MSIGVAFAVALAAGLTFAVVLNLVLRRLGYEWDSGTDGM
jgi:hypothetical protein